MQNGFVAQTASLVVQVYISQKFKLKKYLHFKEKRLSLCSQQCGSSSVVEHNLAKVGVASSNLVSRSTAADLRGFVDL